MQYCCIVSLRIVIKKDGMKSFSEINSKFIKPFMAILLFSSQFLSNREGLFTQNRTVFIIGIIVIIFGLYVLINSSIYLTQARKEKKLCRKGIYKHIRHPIYFTINLLSIGLGLVFFSIYWFVVLFLFIPLWIIECKKEEDKLIRQFGDEYIEYK